MRNSFYCLLSAFLLTATGVPHCTTSAQLGMLLTLGLGIIVTGIGLDYSRWSKKREDD